MLGVEAKLKQHDDAVAQASSRKRLAEDEVSWMAATKEWRRTKRRRSAWLRDRKVAWWDSRADKIQGAADHGDAFGVFATFRELRQRGSSIRAGEVKPKDVETERAAWATHFATIGAGEGEVAARVWGNIPSLSPMDSVFGLAPALSAPKSRDSLRLRRRFLPLPRKSRDFLRPQDARFPLRRKTLANRDFFCEENG